ncbi:MAG: pantoate--beta-alanine ligase [Bacteroidota bacterium]|nr:pantoate--beta-alanine ligase [Bacteroidota bacterium]
MKVFQTVVEIQKYLLEINRLETNSVGFVPTMGALHAGHLSLVKAAKEKSKLTVSSVFVNPTQFNDIKDFERYPIQVDTDLEMLLQAGCDVVFVPSVDDIYPAGVQGKTDVDLGFLGRTLEAVQRPGHFEGVMQVVKRLLDIVQPDFLFLGQKDYQQCMVIARMIEHFHLPVTLEICPTLREPDGLAMSSRNQRLNPVERLSAVKLSKALFYIKEHIQQQTINDLVTTQLQVLSADELIKVEYLAVVDGKTLQSLSEYKNDIPTTVLIAAMVGQVRLIDNVIVTD